MLEMLLNPLWTFPTPVDSPNAGKIRASKPLSDDADENMIYPYKKKESHK